MGSKVRNIEKMEAQIKEWGAKIESLVAKGEMAGEHVRADYRRRVEELRVQGVEAQARFDEFKAAGSETWEAFRTGIEGAWKDLESALKEIRHETSSPKRPQRAAGRRTPPSTSRIRATTPKQPARHRAANR